MSDEKYDVVLFGATGFTGGLTAEYLAKARTPRPLRWALAGRNAAKLADVQARLAQLGAQVDVIVADAAHEASLRNMARSTKVVVTTVGPYLRHGEPLVRACVEERADYLDLTGEPLFVNQMIERYQARAEEHRVKIVNACGFDSIPHDLGVFYALQRLRALAGPLEDKCVEAEGIVRARGSFSGGTWHSALGIMGEMGAGGDRYNGRLPQVGEQRVVRNVRPHVHFRKEIKAWALPLPTIDPAVVRRSARLYPEYGQEFRYGHYLGLPNLPFVAGAALGMGTLFGLAQWKLTRELLLKLKDPGEGPSEETRKKSWFTVSVFAQTGSQRVHCKVSGGDPGYTDTAKMLAESALCLAFDRARTPHHFGVVPPAAAMGQPLLERLQAAGMRFEQL
jgi:short subunit dehydrogenase-like uncharacterized protein